VRVVGCVGHREVFTAVRVTAPRSDRIPQTFATMTASAPSASRCPSVALYDTGMADALQYHWAPRAK
jgi:hypothetical protein